MDPMVSKRRYTSWLSEVQQTVTLKTEKLSQKLHLKKAIVTPPVSTSTSSEMPGERNNPLAKGTTSLYASVHPEMDLLSAAMLARRDTTTDPIVDETIEDKLRKSGM